MDGRSSRLIGVAPWHPASDRVCLGHYIYLDICRGYTAPIWIPVGTLYFLCFSIKNMDILTGWCRPGMGRFLAKICESSSIAVYLSVSDASYAYTKGWRIRLSTSITSLGNAGTCRILVLSKRSIYIHIYIYIYILYPLIVPPMDDYIDHNAPWETFHSSQPSRPL